jgi:molybdate transport system ATP-binding protein
MDTLLKDAILQRLLAFLEDHAIPLIYVTHELTEVFQLGAEVLVLRRGRIARQGLAADALAPERERLLRQIERYTQPS